ncbi:vanin-like protein 1 [Solenopsis invicta]|uniref:vanin-like protein 1 n=1 Tax=Solenopsis invicta TaxID=13686 RepID=UPI0001FEE554|nr:vanin-like protein 1 [Solenopsis invicta]XP_011165378.1 vanin-like protein 1 [Solenopsis invicta]XP_011165381.1 vanin-like protein 1 [Solenopsis invicta]XP_011165383.1 vanin-like protein 1 [Solenopsis invicta]XP_025993530.1 vanin-like protein 1 [Solenopsis invicta]
MDQHWIIVYLLVISAHLSHQRSTPNTTTYRAAVAEYPPKYLTNSSETLKVNSDAYVRLIAEAAGNKADIIVFPEDGLTTIPLPIREEMGDWTTVIPSASDNYTPCNQNTVEVSETLRKISCAASNNEIYVVINIAEKAACTVEPCPKDKVFYYNSNVVFDRTGKIIAKYRKTNLFGEYQFNVTAVPEVVSFDTDFGVKFGTFICFDILFREPALNLTRDHQVTDIVFPTAWFSEAPFLTGVQTQAGWSFAEDVNLLASGYNRPGSGNAGSGIYLGRKGVGIAIMPITTHEKLLIYEVPKIKHRTKYNKNHDHSEDQEQKADHYNGMEHIHDELRKREVNTMMVNDKILLLHDNIHAFETFALEESTKKSICQNGFCCEFKVEVVKIDPSTKYRLVVFNGIRLYGTVKAGVRACGIIQCSNDSVSSCGSVEQSKMVFNNIEIAATFHDYKNSLIMPSTLNPNLLPLKNWIFNEHAHDDHVHVNMISNNNISNLITFGIYSRDFNKNNANRTSFYTINYVIALLVTLVSRLQFI